MAVEMTEAMEAAALIGIAEGNLRRAIESHRHYVGFGVEVAVEAYIKAVDHYIEVTDAADYDGDGL